jgi:7-cyano-7-deazaguanine synthase
MKTLDAKKAVVAFSGGQDSTTCLKHAIDKWGNGNVFSFTINYNQSHVIEVQQAVKIATLLNVNLEIFSSDIFSSLGGLPLIQGGEGNVNEIGDDGLPKSFIPGRNIIFLSIVAAYAYKNGIANIVTGVCETDYSGYPDCRDHTIRCLNATLNYGMDTEFHIHTPLMHKTKKETFRMAADMGILPIIIEHTNTCYNGDRDNKHDWGYGCDNCPACQLRKKGWEEFQNG